MNKLLERDTLARLIHGFLCTCTCVLGFLVPGSISGLVRVAAGPIFGDLLLVASGVIGVLIVLDTYINDIRPPEEQLKWTSKHRLWLHVLGAMGNFVALMTVVMVRPPVGIMMGVCYFYLGTAVFGIVIAWRDTVRRPGHALWGV